MHQRTFLSCAAFGALAVLTGCAGDLCRRGTVASTSDPAAHSAATTWCTVGALLRSGGDPSGSSTIDDGYNDECVDGYLHFAEQSGLPITLLPNGVYAETWDPRAQRLRPLIEAGQVQIANHTMSHLNLVESDDATIRAEIEANEEWIQRVFGVTARPYLRPPYGARDERTDQIAASLGFTYITMWNDTLGDSEAIDPAVLMDLARTHVQPGAIMLGHANSPTVLGLLGDLRHLMIERDLQLVTLDIMFGTSRAQG